MNYADDASRYCIGITDEGSRCNRPAPKRNTGKPARIAYLCYQHRNRISPVHRIEQEALENARHFYEEASRLHSQIYFLTDGHSIKIGTSLDVETRIATLIKEASRGIKGTQRPARLHTDQLHLLGTVPGDLRLERRLHRELIKWRITGEWFQLCSGLKARLAAFGIHLDSEDLLDPKSEPRHLSTTEHFPEKSESEKQQPTPGSTRRPLSPIEKEQIAFIEAQLGVGPKRAREIVLEINAREAGAA